mmetsp:Transcript_32680/g.76210  ORF Transcript_32680/g.76210 Transcript_32680/m.76210 type:complete len:279 (-) Transcript_32680:422-1258(-)
MDASMGPTVSLKSWYESSGEQGRYTRRMSGTKRACISCCDLRKWYWSWSREERRYSRARFSCETSASSMPSNICAIEKRLSSSARCSVSTCGRLKRRPISLSCKSVERTSRRSQLLASSSARVSPRLAEASSSSLVLRLGCGVTGERSPSSQLVTVLSEAERAGPVGRLCCIIFTIACRSSLDISSSSLREKKVSNNSPLFWCSCRIDSSVFSNSSFWKRTSETLSSCTYSAMAAAAPPESLTMRTGWRCLAEASTVLSVPGPPCTTSSTRVTPLLWQ